MDSDTAQLVLLTDEALGEGNSTDLDGLGFSTYSKVLGDAAVGTPGPFTIGVFGEWGTGKTSLMRLIQSYLDEKENVVTVWFNAWRYEREEHPIVPLVATIIRELERNKTFTEKLAEGGKTLIRSLLAAASGFSVKSTIKLPVFAEVEASFVAKDMIERDEKLTSDPLLDRSLYYEAFERLSALSENKNFRIVIIIDDLDRCFPDLAISLLESIKLVLAQPGFIFILGVARSVIEGYLQHRYSAEYGIADFEGHSYLDKIVQLPFHIPPHKERMVDFGEKVLKRISPDFQGELKDILPIIGSASGSNPRTTVMVNHEWQSGRLPKKHIEFTIKNNIILKKLTSDLVSVFRGRMPASQTPFL
ncbi:MAG: KAP family P-loop domain-containing protein [Candidatus Electronema aureum]|uniref:KAP family P-loop domain-containing protein n=2 Tax=Candidatus Electronema aureum TaxID=2005002 RepID=A0A521FZH5_9BACT|nr:MAG: KAP family P-loop domain-containing protein [Candidatus Electronema aureum]